MIPRCTMEHDGLDAYYDDSLKLARVTYPSELNARTTIRMYRWFEEMTAVVGLSNVKGGLFNFCAVTHFHPNNLRAAQRESKKINEKMDLKYFANAFIVQDLRQEQMVRISMKLTQNSDRLRIVHSEHDGIQFIENWHKKHAAES
ncbi:MAG: hypothetical protein L0154_22180 [Chloroflexi bacterium]|nr:hypothetical protein [Chloroflexota bacterium]